MAWRQPGGRTLLATDRFGIEPLCYRIVGTTCSSQPARTTWPATTSTLDPQALFDYLYFHVIPSPRTVFRNIFRLPPGHVAIFERGEPARDAVLDADLPRRSVAPDRGT